MGTKAKDAVLNDRQKLFVSEYLVSRNATQSAIKAGYSEKTAYSMGGRLLKKVEIQNLINKKLEKVIAKLDLTPEKILQDIEDIKERCLQGHVVMDKEGNETGEWRFDPGNALKACELQGKHLKMFTEKVEVDNSGEITINFGIPRPPKGGDAK